MLRRAVQGAYRGFLDSQVQADWVRSRTSTLRGALRAESGVPTGERWTGCARGRCGRSPGVRAAGLFRRARARVGDAAARGLGGFWARGSAMWSSHPIFGRPAFTVGGAVTWVGSSYRPRSAPARGGMV